MNLNKTRAILDKAVNENKLVKSNALLSVYENNKHIFVVVSQCNNCLFVKMVSRNKDENDTLTDVNNTIFVRTLKELKERIRR